MPVTTLNPSYFFDSASFAHAAIFNDLKHIWEVLSRIHPYLLSLPLGKIEIDIPPGVYLKNPELISIGQGTIIEEGAYIRGPCVIGSHCTVRHGAYIRGDFLTGDRCIVGHDTEIKNTLFFNNVHAAHFAYIGDSILGNHVNLGAGVKCANLKLDHGLIEINLEGNRTPTLLRKFGAVLGDHTQIGCNAVTNPGTLLGKNVLCYPCLNIGGFIPSDRILKNETKVLVKSRGERATHV